MKPEATAIGDPQDGRWKITLMFCIPKFRHSTLQQTTSMTSLVIADQESYIFYAEGSLADAGYCRQCRRPAILPLQLWQGCQVYVKISAQRLPRVAQFLRLLTRAFQFAIRIDSIRFVMRIDSNRFVL